MTFVNVTPDTDEPTHDLALSDGRVKIGLQYSGDEREIQVIPISPPPSDFFVHQNTFTGGRGRRKFSSDPSAYFDAGGMWSLTEEKLILNPMWRFASGYRTAEMYQPDDILWKPLMGTKRYVSTSFTAAASFTATKVYLWVRRRGKPGALTVTLNSNGAEAPGTVLKTVTLASSAAVDELSFLNDFTFSSTQSITAGTIYHIVAYGAAASNRDNHWEIGVGTSTSGGKVSAAGSSWSTVNWKPYYRVVDNVTYNRRKERKWFPFSHYGGLYAVHTASLFINGDRGKATAGTVSSLTTDKNFGGTTRYTNGARIRIIDGTGDGQDRAISAHTSGANSVITPDVNFDTAPDNTSVYIIYATDYWTSLAGSTPGLVGVSGRPVSANQIAYFPQAGTTAKKMRLNGSAHEFADVTGTTGNFLEMNTHPTNGVQLLRAAASSASIQVAPATAWASNPTWETAIAIGTSDTRITGVQSHENYFYIFKEDNIFKLDGKTPKGLGKSFSMIQDSSNGFAHVTKDPGLWFSWGNSVSQFVGGSAQDKMNYRTGYSGLPSNRAGTISWLDTGGPWLFACVDGGTGRYSSVLMFNEMGWMEIFRGWKVGERIDSIAWQSNEDAAPRLWIFIGNDIVYMDFPQNNNNPLNDSGFKYTHEGYLETSEYDGDDPVLSKVVHHFSTLTENMKSADGIETLGGQKIILQAKLNGENRWRDVGTVFSANKEIEKRFGKIKTIKLRIIMQTTDASTSPVLTAWGMSGWRASAVKYQWVSQYRTSYTQKTRQKEDDHEPKYLIDRLTKWASDMTPLVMHSVDPALDGKHVVIAAPAIGKRYSKPRDPGKWEGAFSLLIREA